MQQTKRANVVSNWCSFMWIKIASKMIVFATAVILRNHIDKILVKARFI
jgi:hypothetical protein